MKNILITVMLFSLLTSLTAATIDFEEITSGNCRFIGTSFTSQGFLFTKGNASSSGYFSCNAGVVGNNTSPGMIDANHTSNPIMSLVGGGTFSVQSFDAGARFSNTATSLFVSGQKLGGGTVSTTLNFNGTVFETFNLTGFTNLTSISWLGQGAPSVSEFIFDNIVVNEAAAIPEPASFAFLALALAAFMIRKKA